MNFYDLGGVLVRRAKRARRTEAAEAWQDDSWHLFEDLNALLRHGHRLTETDAVLLLHRTRRRDSSLPQWSDDEARLALRAPRRP